jgi:hypothetical protein
MREFLCRSKIWRVEKAAEFFVMRTLHMFYVNIHLFATAVSLFKLHRYALYIRSVSSFYGIVFVL